MIEVFFYNIRQELIKELNAAKSEIKVAVCWFTSNELFEILCEKLNQNIAISLIVLNDAINNRSDGLNFQKFIDLGGKFYFSSIEYPMHNKYCIIDKKIVINGSYNWTYFAENKNKENITVIKEELIASKFVSDFSKLEKECELVSNVNESANNDTQQITIIENARIATDKDIIISNKKEFDDSDFILTSSIGTVLKNDKYFVFINKNTKILKIPKTYTYTLTTATDDVTEYTPKVVFGENTTASLNQEIGSFHVSGIPPLPQGKPGLIYIISLDNYGILSITVKIRETGKMTMHKFNVEKLITKG